MIGVRVLVDSRAEVGEGPIWLDEPGRLRWVDMPAGAVHVTDPVDGATTSTRVAGFVGAVASRRLGGLVVADLRGFLLLDAEGGLEASVPLLDADHRMNDAACDRLGRFWAGSTGTDFAPGEGALHVLHPDRTVDTVAEGLTLPNGMGWSPSGDTFYLADSVAHVVYAYDVDLDTARIGDRRVLHAFSEDDGMPDGLCVDAGGDVWVALWGGSAVVRLSAVGERLETVRIPARQTSSCAFGGPDGATLFVTSAAAGLEPEEGRHDGALFAVDGTGARGGAPTAFAG
jgi:sugar lactone lactonase YvrE